MITKLKSNQIFVFGSNMAGNHAGGAARQALDHFGAIMGQGEGRQGQSYAFPTLTEDFKRRKWSEIHKSRNALYDYCEGNKDQKFLLTKVGCGIAGFKEAEMKALFTNHPKNLILPEDWINSK